MEREIFKSKPFRGITEGLISGFMYGCIILLTGLALGMDEEVFLPLLGVAVVLGGIIGIVSGIGKRIEADEYGIYLKKKEYLFEENDMYMHVYTHYYSFIPVTDRWIDILGKDGKKHKVKCAFLGSQSAGRLAKIIEDGMRKKHLDTHDGYDENNASVRYFPIPAAGLAETIDKRARLTTKLMFWLLTVVFSLVLISSIINDDLDEFWIWIVLNMALNILILGGVNLFICRKFKRSVKKIPYEIIFSGGTMFIDGKAFDSTDITKALMTPEYGYSKGDMRRLVLYSRSGITDEYHFGFKADRSGFPGYDQLIEAVKDNFGDSFAYDVN